MDKNILKITRKLENTINKINAEVNQLMQYTGDKMPLLDSDGDSYGISSLSLENGKLNYTITNFNKSQEYNDTAIRFDADTNEPYIEEDIVDFFKTIKKDCKRGLKDFKMFNPDIHQDEEGFRKSNFMDKLNNDSNIVKESLSEFIKVK